MIKLNFIEKKKTASFDAFGMDFSNIKWLFVGISLLFYMAAPFAIDSYMKPQGVKIDKSIVAVKKKIRTIIQKLKINKKLKNKIEEFEDKKKKLIKIRKTIETIVSSKKNPYNVLLFIAKNIPKNIWINNLEISDLDILTIEGESLSNVNIATFVENLKNSFYFKRHVQISNLKSKTKYLNYSLKVHIDRYNE